MASSGPLWAAPADVNAQRFYADAVALEGKGMAAMFDKRTKPMIAQMQDAGARAKATNEAATGLSASRSIAPPKPRAGKGSAPNP